MKKMLSKNWFLIVVIFILSIKYGFAQDVNPQSLNSLEIAKEIASNGGHVTIMAEQNLELQREYNKSVRKELTKSLKPYRLISVIAARVQVDGVEAVRFTYTWYALMKNSFINEVVNIPVK